MKIETELKDLYKNNIKNSVLIAMYIVMVVGSFFGDVEIPKTNAGVIYITTMFIAFMLSGMYIAGVIVDFIKVREWNKDVADAINGKENLLKQVFDFHKNIKATKKKYSDYFTNKKDD